MKWPTSSTRHAIQITVFYFIISASWIFFSDRLLESFVTDNQSLVQLQTYKGLLFVLVTTVLLYYLIKRNASSIIESRDKAEETLREKQQVLSELHHRVKNNLALISSLIQLQVSNMDKHEATALVEIQHRIFALAEIEELLYQNLDISRVPFHEYVNQFAVKLEKEANDISFEVQADKLYLNIDQAITLGLLFNEILTQLRMKESKDQDTARIKLACPAQNDVLLKLTFDDVKPSVFSPLKEEGHIEKMLLEQYIKQLDASASWRQEKKSVIFKLDFEKNRREGSLNN